MFWNVAGVGGKDKDFWEGLKGWEVIVLMETWLDEKGWVKVKGKLPEGYEWGVQLAKREGKRGRCKGGMLMGIRKDLVGKEGISVGEVEGVMRGKVGIGREEWWVIGVYVSGEIGRILKELERWVGDREIKILIGGDFNARTGREGGGVEGEEDERGWERERRRKSKDEKLNRRGKLLIEFIEEWGMGIFNGRLRGDEEGEYTFTGGKGNTVIDYIMGDKVVEEKVERMKIGDKVDSDHHPIEVWINGEVGRKRERKGGRKLGKGVWDEEGKRMFRQKMEEAMEAGREGKEEWEEVGGRIRGTIKEVEKSREKRKETEGWWDEECKERKREVRRELRKWRRGGEEEGELYRKKRKEYNELCKRKKEEENERWERKAREARRESEVWEIVNRDRKRRRKVNEGIGIEEWKEYFMELLGGVENKVVRGYRDRGGEEDGEENISEEEFRRALGRLRNGKAAGVDEIPGEVWKYGGEGLERWAWEYCNRVWKGGGWPEEWKEGIVVPIIKKREGNEVRDYRGVTLLSTLYKSYVAILTERLREEVESKGIIPHNQTGFRGGMGTMDNIYVLNYLIGRQVGKKGGRMVALFVDLKAAFDSVDRGIVIEAMRERGVRESLVRRVEELMGETRNRVRVRGRRARVSGLREG